MRIASLPDERWVVKAAEWNPELNTKYKTYRAVGRPRKRWEDEINDFLKHEETEPTSEDDMKNNNTWIKVAKNRERWKAIESEYAETAEERNVDNFCYAEKTPPHEPIRPARYLNGAKLDDDEVANII